MSRYTFVSKSTQKYIVLFLGITVISILLHATSFRLTPLTWYKNNEKIDMGSVFPISGPSTFTIKTNVLYRSLSQYYLHITPDDCVLAIYINSKKADLSHLGKTDLCNVSHGFDINLKPYLVHGNNTMEIELENYGGYVNIFIGNSYKDTIFLALYIFLIAAIFLCIYFCLKSMSFSIAESGIILFGIFLFLIYHGQSNIFYRQYDVWEYGGHIDYIYYVLTHVSLPLAPSGWQFYQPPLYYIVSAILLFLLEQFKFLNPWTMLQFSSLFYFVVFLIYGCKIIKLFINNKPLAVLSIALLVLWPSGIIHTARISNDVLFYLLYTAALYHFLKWYKQTDVKDFLLSSIFFSLGLFSKTNMLILFVIFVCIIVYSQSQHTLSALILKSIRTHRYVFFLSLCIFCIGFIGWVANAKLRQSPNLIVGNIGVLNSNLRVDNTGANFLTFDIASFLTEPFTATWVDRGGRQFFWNFFLKSSLFGEFTFPGIYRQKIAIILSILLLAIISMTLISTVTQFFVQHNSNTILFLIMLLIPIISLLAYRYIHPFAPNQDFRFIYPSIIGGLLLFTQSLERAYQLHKKYLYYGGILISFTFCISVILFFLPIIPI